MSTSRDARTLRPLKPLANLIFASRWLQLPLYLGLIVAQGVYVWLFWQELYYLLLAAFGNAGALDHVIDAVTVEGVARPGKLTETVIMLTFLLSAMAIAASDRIMPAAPAHHADHA